MSAKTPPNSNHFSIKFDLRYVCLALLAVIIVMLIIWKPWKIDYGEARKITITGHASIKAEPDEFTFNPYYEFGDTPTLTQFNQQIITKLKELGLSDKQIKVDAGSYAKPIAQPIDTVPTPQQSTLSLTITVDKRELAQKVQDYLVSTNPKGTITPYPSFSTTKQKQLEDDARTKAIADARARAEKAAQGLDIKINKVLEVKEGQAGGDIIPLYSRDSVTAADTAASPPSLSLQPGEQEYDYSVQVVFSLK